MEMTMTTTQKPVLSIAETGRLLDLDPRTVSKAIEDGTIKAIRLGKRTLVLREPLMKMLNGEA